MRITPTEDRVIVQPIPNADKSKGGLFVPEQVKSQPSNLGVIKAIGPGKPSPATGLLIPVDGLKVGYLVMYPAQAGFDFEHEGVPLKTIRASDIIQYDPDYKE